MRKRRFGIPGIRFSPTDVELVLFFLKRKILGKYLPNIISEVNIYKFSPWDLPDKAALKTGDLEWHFLCPKDRKYGTGIRSNRAVEGGFWKSTGKDRHVKQNTVTVGMIKTLVFHIGQVHKGERTNWVIYEYRIVDPALAEAGIQDAYVLCKLFEKSGSGPKTGEQHGAPFKEEEWDDYEHNDEDEELLISFSETSAIPTVLQQGECSYAATQVPEPAPEPAPAPAPEPAYLQEDLTTMLQQFVAEISANIEADHMAMNDFLHQDDPHFFDGLGDLGDGRGLDEAFGALPDHDPVHDDALYLHLDDLDDPLEENPAPSTEDEHYSYSSFPR